MHMQQKNKSLKWQKNAGDVLELKSILMCCIINSINEKKFRVRENLKKYKKIYMSEQRRDDRISQGGGKALWDRKTWCEEATLYWCYWEPEQSKQEVRKVSVCMGHRRTGRGHNNLTWLVHC